MKHFTLGRTARRCLAAAAIATLGLAGPMADASAEAPQGEIRIVFPSLWNEALDPILSSSSGSVGLAAMYDGLIGTKADGSGFSKENGLATDWVMSEDGKTWTITLRQGVQFHRGFGELTAEDVKFSLERIGSERSVAQRKSYFKSKVGEIAVVDPYTIRITAKDEPIADLLTNLSALQGSVERFIVSKKAAEELGPDGFASNPVGTGRYQFAEHVGGQFIRLAAFDDYWGTKPRFAEVRFLAVPEEETSIAMLQRGEADVAPISRSNIARLQDSEGTDVVLQKGSVALNVYMDDQFVESVPVHQAKVREALNLAVDREAIAATIYEGFGQPVGTYYTQTRVLDAMGYDWKKDLYAYDPERAKQLLAEAGYPDGFEMDVYIYPWIGVPEAPQMMQALAGMWDGIGIRTNITSTEYGVVRGRLIKGEIPGAIGYFVAPARPWQAMIGIYRVFMHSGGAFGHVNSETLDGHLDTASNAVAPAESKESLEKAIHFVREHHLAIPVVEVDQAYGVTDKAVAWDPGFLPQNLNYDSLLAQ